MKKEDKGIVISQLTETVKEYPNFYLTDIEALDAEKTSKLRRECFKQEIDRKSTRLNSSHPK